VLQRTKRESALLRASEDREEHYPGFEVPGRPFYGGMRSKILNRKRAVSFKEISDGLALKDNMQPSYGGMTTILDGSIGLRAFPAIEGNRS